MNWNIILNLWFGGKYKSERIVVLDGMYVLRRIVLDYSSFISNQTVVREIIHDTLH